MKFFSGPAEKALSLLITLVFLSPNASGQSVCGKCEDLKDQMKIGLHSALQELVNENGNRRVNTLFVSRIDQDGMAHVYWKEGNALILIEPQIHDFKYALVWSRRYWNLKTDVVPTENDLNGSTYKLTRNYARKFIRDCLRGKKYIVIRNRTVRS